MSKKKPSSIDKVTAGYEKFIKDKKLKEDGKDQFETALKKASNAKPKK